MTPSFKHPKPQSLTLFRCSNGVGQLTKVTETGLAATLIEYNAWQQAFRSGLDVNANNTLDLNSLDRIAETDGIFEKDGSGAWWSKLTTKTYNQDNDATPVTTGSSKFRLNKFPSGIQSETVATDIFGNETRNTLHVDRTTSLVTETVDYPDSTTDLVSVTRNGLPQKIQSKEGLVSRSYYDARGRLVKQTDPRTDTSTTARLGYVTNSNRLAWREDTAGNRTTYAYESATGRLASQTDPLGKAARYAYTTRGELHRTWGETTYPVEYGYDNYGQRTTMNTYRGGSGWDGSSWPGSPGSADSPGTADTTTWAYDDATGLLTTKTDAAHHSVGYTYNTRGQLATRTWARGVVTTYGYDPQTGEQLSVSYPGGTTNLGFEYNRLGQAVEVSDATGTRHLEYCTCGKLHLETLDSSFFGSRTLEYKLDQATAGALGRTTGYILSGSSGVEQETTYGYDTYGRSTSVGVGAATYTYGYTANSNLIGAISDGTWSQGRTYDPTRNLLSAIETAHGISSKAKFEYAHDALGRRTGVAKTGAMFARYGANGLETTWSYNDRSEVIGEQTVLGGTATALTGRDDAYGYDNLGNRTSVSHNGTAASYTSNALNQYTQRAVPGTVDVAGLAPAGAAITVNSNATTRHNDYYFKGESVTNTANAVWSTQTVNSAMGGSLASQVLVAKTPEAFVYDDDGNLLSDGKWDYTYDAENASYRCRPTRHFPPAFCPMRRRGGWSSSMTTWGVGRRRRCGMATTAASIPRWKATPSSSMTVGT
jgi:YD repeat-containing protein